MSTAEVTTVQTQTRSVEEIILQAKIRDLLRRQYGSLDKSIPHETIKQTKISALLGDITVGPDISFSDKLKLEYNTHFSTQI